MRRKTVSLTHQAFLFGLLIGLAGMMNEPVLKAAPINNFYQPAWASVDQHNPVPEWF